MQISRRYFFTSKRIVKFRLIGQCVFSCPSLAYTAGDYFPIPRLQ